MLVYQLGAVHVAGNRTKRIGIGRAQRCAFGNEFDHFPQSLFCSFVQVRIDAHADVVAWGFGSGHGEGFSLVDMHLECPVERSLYSGDTDLAVALCRVSVATSKEGAIVEHWQVKYRARGQFLEVEIAAKIAGDD